MINFGTTDIDINLWRAHVGMCEMQHAWTRIQYSYSIAQMLTYTFYVYEYSGIIVSIYMHKRNRALNILHNSIDSFL